MKYIACDVFGQGINVWLVSQVQLPLLIDDETTPSGCKKREMH